jgi:hypothetical protein
MDISGCNLNAEYQAWGNLHKYLLLQNGLNLFRAYRVLLT